MLELHGSVEISMGEVSRTRSVLDLHESRDDDLEGEKLGKSREEP